MISEIWTFFQLGFTHILDIKGYDHILFLMAMCALYTHRDYKTLLWLVTAFTVGHSLTLALAVNNVVTVSSDWIEFLIPVTILLTAIYDLSRGQSAGQSKIKYALILGFGLIHGMGFSNFLKAILGGSDDLFLPLLSFNIGLEVGQIIFIGLLMLIGYIVVDLFGLRRKYWTFGLLVIAAVEAIHMIIDRIGAIL